MSNLRLPEKITHHNANLVLDEMLKHISFEKNKTLVLDISSVEHCDSSGISVLISAHAHFARASCELTFKNLSSQVSQMLALFKLEKLLLSE